ncbi:GNAT family N-acetyltransferase [Arenibaculum pallidiluteum]|uniref:GNAT family N-acetyltransferase n=1 Tax=Arenibaculum pallidiluteum TaxID=2812559 RepID=UPI001A95C7D5|nr:N-acetyltransferase [Arenibaculum pallidiluteum]
MTISEESLAHHDAVAALNRAAFGGEHEAELVRRLRADGLVASSLVALEGGDVVGHILYSELAVTVDGTPVRAVSLAPMAVRPDRQRRGIGSRLVAESLPLLRARGWGAVVVLGHPGFYPRFGFSAALAAKLASPFTGPAFMALELSPGALAGRAGQVLYPPAFGIGH